MTLADFDALCRRLPGAAMVIQWGDSHVWKIGGKVFAIGGDVPEASYVFKATALSFEIMLAQGIATRAPYLPRGNWVRVPAGAGMADDELGAYIKQSYQLIAATLTKIAQRALGLTG